MIRTKLAGVSLIAVMAASSASAETVSEQVLNALTEAGMTYETMTRENGSILLTEVLLGDGDHQVQADSVVIEDAGAMADITLPAGMSIFSGTEQIDIDENDLVISTNGFMSETGEFSVAATNVAGSTFTIPDSDDASAENPEPELTGEFTMTDIAIGMAGVFGTGEGGLDLGGEYEIGSLSLSLEDEASPASLEVDEITGGLEAVISREVMDRIESDTAPDDFSGITVLATVRSGESRMVVNSVPGAPASQVGLISQSGQAEVSVRNSVFDYKVASTGAEGSFARDGMDPVSFSVGPVTAEFSVPLQDIEQAPFSFGYGVEDVVLSDSGWSLLDPAGVIPRTPASVILRMTGVFSDNGPSGEPVGLSSVDVSDFTVKFGGMDLSAKGGMVMAADGVTPESGNGDVTITGLQALLDAVESIVPADALNGVRMGIAMMFVEDGEDRLVSKTEIRDSEVYVNGQRFR